MGSPRFEKSRRPSAGHPPTPVHPVGSAVTGLVPGAQVAGLAVSVDREGMRAAAKGLRAAQDALRDLVDLVRHGLEEPGRAYPRLDSSRAGLRAAESWRARLEQVRAQADRLAAAMERAAEEYQAAEDTAVSTLEQVGWPLTPGGGEVAEDSAGGGPS